VEDFDEFVESLCIRPQIYQGCGREFRVVIAYLKGYCDGAGVGTYREDKVGPLGGFNRFITDRFHYDWNFCWDGVILKQFGGLDSEEALDAFRSLYQEFRVWRDSRPSEATSCDSTRSR
jgi:hypothetical protein